MCRQMPMHKGPKLMLLHVLPYISRKDLLLNLELTILTIQSSSWVHNSLFLSSTQWDYKQTLMPTQYLCEFQEPELQYSHCVATISPKSMHSFFLWGEVGERWMGEKDGDCVFLAGIMCYVNQVDNGLTEMYLSVLLNGRVCHNWS